MLTLSTLAQIEWVTKWDLSGNALPVRTFYYTQQWREAVSRLSGLRASRLGVAASPRARVEGLVERFVAGDRRATLITPKGYGSEPPFKRLDRPHEVVVTMRTLHTRSFGFFAAQDTYVALFLAELSALKPSHGSGPRRRGRKDPYRAFAAKVETFLSRLTANEIDRTTDVEDLISDPSGNC